MHIFIQFFSAATFRVSALPLERGKNELSNTKAAPNTYAARSARGPRLSGARIRRAGRPPSAPQPQFGPRRTDRSNSLRLTADKRGAINTGASGEEAGMELRRKKKHYGRNPQRAPSAGARGQLRGWATYQLPQLEQRSITPEDLRVDRCVYVCCFRNRA